MLEAIFAPQSVAIVGASPDQQARAWFRNVVDNGYAGRVFPVHPTAPTVLDLPAFPSVSAVPEPIDLAVIVVPPAVLLGWWKVRQTGGAWAGGDHCWLQGIGGAGKELEQADRTGACPRHLYGWAELPGIIDTISRLNASLRPSSRGRQIAFCLM